jgi:hypothetical protein
VYANSEEEGGSKRWNEAVSEAPMLNALSQSPCLNKSASLLHFRPARPQSLHLPSLQMTTSKNVVSLYLEPALRQRT